MESMRRVGDDSVALGRQVLSKRRPAVSPPVARECSGKKGKPEVAGDIDCFPRSVRDCVVARQVREKGVGGKDDVDEGGSSCRRTGGRARKKSTHPLRATSRFTAVGVLDCAGLSYSPSISRLHPAHRSLHPVSSSSGYAILKVSSHPQQHFHYATATSLQCRRTLRPRRFLAERRAARLSPPSR